METRYHYGFGKTSREPQLALHASKEVYNSIKNHLLRKTRIQERIDKEVNHRKSFKEAAKAMTDQWENSVENMRRKKEEERQIKLAQKIDDRVEKYHQILKLQAEDRRKYNEKVARRVFMESQPQKELNSGLLLSEAHYENSKQIELKKKIEKEAKEDWHKFEQQIIQEDLDFNKKNKGEKSITRLKAKKHQEILKQQIADRKKDMEEEKARTVEEERLDLANQLEENKIILQNNEKDFRGIKLKTLKELRNSREEAAKLKEEDRLKDLEFTKVCQIFKCTKEKINCKKEMLKKTKIKEIQDMQEVACQELRTMLEKKQDEEDNRIAKAQAERDAADNLKQQMEEEAKEKAIQDRKSNFKEALERKLEEKSRETEVKKWEMLNRIKQLEVFEKEKIARESIRRNKMKEYGKLLEKQIMENKERAAREKAEAGSLKWKNYIITDKKFLEYGEEMVRKQKEEGKITYPMEHTMMTYKKLHGLDKIPSKLAGSNEEKQNIKSKKFPTIICPLKDPSEKTDCFCV